jgi:hypothetical protein
VSNISNLGSDMSDQGSYHSSGTLWWPDKSDWLDILDLGSDMSDLAVLPCLCDPMKMSNQANTIGNKMFCKGFEHSENLRRFCCVPLDSTACL